MKWHFADDFPFPKVGYVSSSKVTMNQPYIFVGRCPREFNFTPGGASSLPRLWWEESYWHGLVNCSRRFNLAHKNADAEAAPGIRQPKKWETFCGTLIFRKKSWWMIGG